MRLPSNDGPIGYHHICFAKKATFWWRSPEIGSTNEFAQTYRPSKIA